MNRGTYSLAFLALLSLAAIVFYIQRSPFWRVSERQNHGEVTRTRAIDSYVKLPLSFEANQGQTDSEVRFLSRGNGYTLFLTSTEAVLSLKKSVLRMKLVGANPNAEVFGLEDLPGKRNYFIGNDPAKWRTNVPTYAKVRYEDVYSGIDLVYYGNQRQLEYDFVVAPGADPDAIRLGFQGADKLEVDAQGDLIISVFGEQFSLRKPLVYQEVDGQWRQVPGGYLLEAKNQIGFHIPDYDATKPLVIDPMLVYSGVFSGANARAIALDSFGNAYVAGDANGAGFPTTPGAIGPSPGTGLFIAKVSADGSMLLYSTYVASGSLRVRSTAYAIAIDTIGNAYVTGFADPGFPTTPGAFQTSTPTGQSGPVVVKLNPDGSQLVYSTYIGTRGSGFAIASDAFGNAYITGFTTSASFPASSPIQPGYAGGDCAGQPCPDAFVVKLNALGTGLLYSTFLGGPGADIAYGIAVDPAGSAYVTGVAGPGFLTTAGAFQRSLPSGGAFVAKLNPFGSSLVYSTYLGGDRSTIGFRETIRTESRGITVDSAGNVYVTGFTNSSDFPTVNGFQTRLSQASEIRCDFVDLVGPVPCFDAFVSKLDTTGSSLVYSTFFGGVNNEYGNGIALDRDRNAYIVGVTSSETRCNFPVVNALQPEAGTTSTTSIPCQFGVPFAPFVAKVSSTGNSLLFSSYLAGSRSSLNFGGPDWANGIAVDSAGDIYVVGYIGPTDIPLTPGSFGTSFRYVGGLVAKISLSANPAPRITSLSPSSVTNQTTGLDLIVSGSGFFAGSVVIWNGSPRPTKVLNLGLLTAQLSAQDVSISGTAIVSVFNPPPGGGASNAFPFTVDVNPVPAITSAITSLQPSSVAPGGPGFVLTVLGNSFVNGAVVRWNGSERPTTFFSNTQLTAFIPASDIASPGTAQVTVFNPAPGGGTSNTATFTIQPSSGVGGTVIRADITVWRPLDGTWNILPSDNPNAPITLQWGTSGDIPVPGDYDGDRKSDFAVWRPSDGIWYILPSTNPNRFAPITVQWGTEGDIPVPGDYDGDARTDTAVWRPSEGTWYILPSSNPNRNTPLTVQWGTSGDIPVPGDYDGDGRPDSAIWRPSNGTWYILRSSNPNRNAPLTYQWGTNGDIPVPGDYEGDGKPDSAVWRPSNGTWYILRSSNPDRNAPITRQWGTSGDIPVPGDYDGDAKTDFAVWRPSDGTWYIIPTTAPNTSITRQWGTANDVPLFLVNLSP